MAAVHKQGRSRLPHGVHHRGGLGFIVGQLAVAVWLNSASTTYLEFQNLADYGLNDNIVHALYFQ